MREQKCLLLQQQEEAQDHLVLTNTAQEGLKDADQGPEEGQGRENIVVDAKNTAIGI